MPEYTHNFKKSLGQNFLRSEIATLGLIESINPTSEDTVLEIGPGDGIVTSYLVNMVRKIYAVEVDSDLMYPLNEMFENIPQVKLINASILDVNLEKTLDENEVKTYKVIGSLPYNISKKIIDKFMFDENSPEIMGFIVQKEVGENYAARAPKATFLSYYASIFYEVKLLQKIDKGLFYPRPQVDGAVLQFKKRKKPLVDPKRSKDFSKFLKSAFLTPRKQLKKVLTQRYKDVEWEPLFKELKVKPNARAAEVSFSDMLALWKATEAK